jgi:hypothetical protein
VSSAEVKIGGAIPPFTTYAATTALQTNKELPHHKIHKKGKYIIFRAQSYTKIRSPINKIATIAVKTTLTSRNIR